MFDWYYHFKLWRWWKYTIKEDEFSSELDYWGVRTRHIADKNISVDVLNDLVVRQRNLAHELDNGTKVTDIPRKLIERARI